MKNRILVLGLLGALLFICNAARAGDRQFSVYVSVPIKNELTDHVKSFLTRELLERQDIRLIDEISHEERHYVISIVALPFKLPSRVAVGVVLSYVFEDGHQIVHGVLTGAPDDLEILSERVVSIFDFKYLEPNRHN